MNKISFLDDDLDNPGYLPGPFTIEQIASKSGVDVAAARAKATGLRLITQLESNQFDGQTAFRLSQELNSE